MLKSQLKLLYVITYIAIREIKSGEKMGSIIYNNRLNEFLRICLVKANEYSMFINKIAHYNFN